MTNEYFQTGTWSPSYGANITMKRFITPGVFGNKTLIVSTLLVRNISSNILRPIEIADNCCLGAKQIGMKLY